MTTPELKPRRIKCRNAPYFLKVDPADYPIISKYKWYIKYPNKHKYPNSKYYTFSCTKSINGKVKAKTIARMILGGIKGLIDHINGDTRDNRRSNLRVVDQKINSNNRKIYTPNKSGFIGVDKYYSGWRAQIWDKGRTIHLGTFKTAKEAAIARDNMAKKLRGSLARLNFG